MKKIVNGQLVDLSPAEEAAVLADWEANLNRPSALSFTPLQFIERFTNEEQAAIVAAAKDNAAINLWLLKAMGASEIVNTDPRTVAGMDALVSAGLLTAERRNEILGVS